MKARVILDADIVEMLPSYMEKAFLVAGREYGTHASDHGHALGVGLFEIHGVLTSQIKDVPLFYVCDFGHRRCEYEVSEQLFVEACRHFVEGEYLFPLNDAVSSAITVNHLSSTFWLLVRGYLSFFSNWILAAEFRLDTDQHFVGNNEHDVGFSWKSTYVRFQLPANFTKSLVCGDTFAQVKSLAPEVQLRGSWRRVLTYVSDQFAKLVVF